MPIQTCPIPARVGKPPITGRLEQHGRGRRHVLTTGAGAVQPEQTVGARLPPEVRAHRVHVAGQGQPEGGRVGVQGRQDADLERPALLGRRLGGERLVSWGKTC